MSTFEDVLGNFEDIIYSRSVDHTSYNDSELVKGQLVFISGWCLEFIEFKSSEKHKYRFHLMDENDEMIERWDTAPHHQELDNFPFHKHTQKGIKSTDELKGTEILEHMCEKVLEKL